MIHIIRFTVMILIMRIEANRDKKGKRKKIVIKKKEARRCFGCRSSSTRRRNGCAVFPCVPVINDGGGGAPPPPPRPAKQKKRPRVFTWPGKKGKKMHRTELFPRPTSERVCVCVWKRLGSRPNRYVLISRTHPVFLDYTGTPLDWTGLNCLTSILRGFTWFYWVLLGFTGFC